MNDADVIIIGAGHNSLAAGMGLVKVSLRVLIWENANIARGAAESGKITLPGYTYILYATNVYFFMGGKFMLIMGMSFISMDLK